MKRGLFARWTATLAQGTQLKPLGLVLMGMAILGSGLVAVGLPSVGFGVLSLDFFLLADFLTAWLAKHRVTALLSLLLGAVLALVIYGVVVFGLSVIFKQ